MKLENDRKVEPGLSQHGVANMIEAVDRTIHAYLLRQHLSLWHPMSTAPSNHDLELIVLDGGSTAVLPFPCRRTNAGAWIDTDLQTAIQIQPMKWRPWQKANSGKPRLDTKTGLPRVTRNAQRWSDT
jgi:hypothetical protein